MSQTDLTSFSDEEEEEEIADEVNALENTDTRRNLIDLFDTPMKTRSSSIEPSVDQMKVYLRIRPFTEEEILNHHSDLKIMNIESPSTLTVSAPKESAAFKNTSHLNDHHVHRFTFSKIFDDTTNQKQFFDQTTLRTVKDFINGQNCLVFTYGVTNAGKTYTIQGHPKDGGILPRSLDVVFNSIHNKLFPCMSLKPKNFCDVVRLNETQEKEELARKDAILNLAGSDWSTYSLLGETQSSSHSTSISSENYSYSNKEEHIELQDNEKTSIDVESQGPILFSVWVSFAEVYNENIFDLLDPIPKNEKRKILKLSEDKHGNIYIKGLKEVCIFNAYEANKLLTIGQKNLRIASTKINQNSSRSHCIFSIKVLRVVDKDAPHVARISKLSFCDLAGSERHTKTQSTGERLKEAGLINTSLLTLGRCLEALRFNQIHRIYPRIIPFRDSKLTRIFQAFFTGKGKASMVVNISQCASMFDETLHVLRFSAIAKQVTSIQFKVPEPKLLAPKPARDVSLFLKQAFSPSVLSMTVPWETPSLIRNFKNAVNLPLPESSDEEIDKSEQLLKIEELNHVIKHLKQLLVEEKIKLANLEVKIREEVCEEFAKQFVEMEDEYSDRIEEAHEASEDLADKKIDLLTQSIKKAKKRIRQEDPEEEFVSSVLLLAEQIKIKEQEHEIKSLIDQVEKLKENLHKVMELQTKTQVDNSCYQFQLSDAQNAIHQLKDDLERSFDDQAKLQAQLQDLQSLALNQSSLCDQRPTICEDCKNAQERLLDFENKLKASEKLNIDLSKQIDVYAEDIRIRSVNSSVDLLENEIVKNLQSQLEDARNVVKKQQFEIQELNETLNEAGEAFHHKEIEINKLKDALTDSEEKALVQEETVKDLQFLVAESGVVIEDSNSKLLVKENLISDLEKQNSTYKEINNKVISLEGELKTSQEELKKAKSQIKDLEHFKIAPRNLPKPSTPSEKSNIKLLMEANNERKLAENKLKELEQSLNDKDVQNRSLMDDVNILKKRTEEQEVKIKDLEESFQYQGEQHKNLCNELNKQLEELQEKYETEKQLVLQNKKEIEELKMKCHELKEEQQNLAQENQKISMDYNKIQLELGRLNKKDETLQQELLCIKEELTKTQERELSLRNQIQEYTSLMAKKNEEIFTLSSRIDHVGKQVLDKEKSLFLSQDTTAIIKKDKNELEKKVKELTETLCRKNENIQEKDEIIMKLENSLSSQSLCLEATILDTNNKTDLLEQLKNALAEQDSMMNLQDKLMSDKEEEIKILQNDLDQYIEDCQKLKKETRDHNLDLTAKRNKIILLEKNLEENAAELLHIKKLHSDSCHLIEELKLKLKTKDNDCSQLHDKLSLQTSKVNELVNDNKKLEESMVKVESLMQPLLEEKKQVLEKEIEKTRSVLLQKKKADKEIDKLKGEVDNLKSELVKQAESKEKEMTEWRHQRDELVQSLDKILKEKNTELKALQSELNNQKGGDTEEFKCRLKKIENQFQKEKELHEKTRQASEQSASTDAKIINDLKIQLANLTEENHSLQDQLQIRCQASQTDDFLDVSVLSDATNQSLMDSDSTPMHGSRTRSSKKRTTSSKKENCDSNSRPQRSCRLLNSHKFNDVIEAPFSLIPDSTTSIVSAPNERRKRNLVKLSTAMPFQCSPFVVPESPDKGKSSEVHNIVTRKLRSKKK